LPLYIQNKELVSLENLKLSPVLLTAMLDAGYLAPKEIQNKTISRMVGGQNIIGVGHEGCGKSTAFVLSVLMRLKGHVEGAPRALILAPNREKVLALTAHFKWLGKNTGIRISGLTTGLGLMGDHYMEMIEDGIADIVIGTPDKINALYVKSTLNLRSLMVFVVDDVDMIFKLSLQAPVYNIAEGLSKCQRLVFTDVVNEKLNKLTELLMPNAVLADVLKFKETDPGTIDMVLYKTPNYKTKLNLLELMLRDSKIFTKAAVFVNTRTTAETLYNNLKKRLGKNIAILNHGSYNHGFDSVETFKQAANERIILLCNEDQPSFNLLGIPYIFHMEIPEKYFFINRVKKLTNEEKDKPVSITFATNVELELIKKIEQSTGKTMQVKELPSELVIESNSKKKVIDKEIPDASNEKKEDWDWKVK
jgi:ATP-dependent RNA helicase RhlE